MAMRDRITDPGMELANRWCDRSVHFPTVGNQSQLGAGNGGSNDVF